jgi:hypothetical protein
VAIVRFLRFLPAAGFVLAASALLGVPADAQAQIGITINGNPVNVEPPPIEQAGRVFVPLRGVFQDLGASVDYQNGQINAQGNGREIGLRIGSTQADVNGQPVTIDVAPFIVGESTYVPLRFVSESLGAGVDWDDSSQTVQLSMAGLNYQPQDAPPSYGYSDVDESFQSDQPPPELPYDAPPPCPQPNYIWTPGYWAFGFAGFFWVPGTWVEAPQTGYLWTPGYWGWQNGYYGWNPGYWAPSVGFYGGVNYGGGYYGNGYAGGRWHGNQFQYNTAVAPVNPTYVHATYVNRAVIVNPGGARVAYNGGRGGLGVRPTSTQLAVAHLRHLPPPAAQVQHVQVAAQNRNFLASVNHGHPAVLSVARPLTTTAKPAGFAPIRAQDRAAAPAAAKRLQAAAVARPAAPAAARPPAPAYHPAAPAAARPAAPAYHPAAPAAPAYHPPAAAARPAAPAYHPPAAAARPAAPAYHPAPVQRPAAPAYHPAAPAAARPAAPAYHPPAAAPARPAAQRRPPVQHAPPAQPHPEHTP